MLFTKYILEIYLHKLQQLNSYSYYKEMSIDTMSSSRNILSLENARILKNSCRSQTKQQGGHKLGHIILDLDNTIISAIPYSALTEKHRHLPYQYHAFENDFVIFERPGVQRFLDFLFSNFIVSVWSAGSRDYVNFVVKSVITRDGQRQVPRSLYLVLNADHCEISRVAINPSTPKDLKFLWNNNQLSFSPENTLIIDDLPAVYSAQPSNCIAIPAFDVETSKGLVEDTVLAKLMDEMKLICK
jgi:NLI interacting factor-like phosphatase